VTVEFHETTDMELIERVRHKFRSPVQQLKMLGFMDMGFYEESVAWLGLFMGPVGLFGFLGLLFNEVTKFGERLSIKAFYPVSVSREHAAYAACSNLGINFYTSFTDGTLLVSSTFDGIEIRDDQGKMYKFARSRPIQDAWAAHQQQVTRFCETGKQVKEVVGVADFLSLETRMAQYMLKNPKKLSAGLDDGVKPLSFKWFFNTLVSSFVPIGMLVGCFLIVCVFPNIVHRQYPACWYYRNFQFLSVPLNLLAIPASFVLSWILARVQTNLLTIEGVGTRLFGREPAPDTKGYIATKWLAIFSVPLVPVRSYLVTDERTTRWGETGYEMKPLRKLNWPQIKDTARKSILWYAVCILVLVGMAVWSFSQCM
jgi:hypothetical protein